MKILVVGIGSIVRGDDGIGPRVIDELEKDELPSNVKLHSGDVSGLDLLKVFPGYENVIIIDAADFGAQPGSFKVFNFDSIEQATFKDVLSTHGMALLETLTIAKKLDMENDITIIGVQPEDISYNLDLSDTVKRVIPDIIKKIKELILQLSRE